MQRGVEFRIVWTSPGVNFMNSNLLAMSKPGPAMPESPRLNSRRNMVFKRAFDIFASLALIALLLPLFVIVACAIMVQDGRPILFGHRRIGRNGKPFQCWKFRTMVS